MSSTGKMVLFFAAATVFNILLMVGFVLVAFVLVGLIPLRDPNSPVRAIILFVAFLGSIVGTFFIYGWVMKKVTVKWKLEKHIPQLFKKKK
jgi:hypothetical protein